MAASTVYDIRLQYVMEDKATRPMRKLDAQLARTAKSAGGLGRTFRRMAAGVSAYFGIRAGVKHLIGFNANMEQAKIQMAGMIQLSTNMNTAASNTAAVKMVDTLQQKAKASVGTTKDMVDMASMITRPVLAAGLNMEQLANFTASAVVAAKAFGIEAGMAARDIESAMMGQLRSVDRFSRALLEPMGFVGDEGRKAFNELGAAARAAKLEEALGGPAIAAMAQAQAQSFSGVLSTFQDGLQMWLGSVGKPLFQEITAEIRTWNSWIEKNGDKMADTARAFGKGLVDGFRTVKSVIGFMVDHADLLMTVAKVWATVKIGQKIGGMADTLGHMAGGLARRAGGLGLMAGMDGAGLATAKFGVKLTSTVSKFASFIPAIGLAGLALKGIWDWYTSEDRARAKKINEEKGEALGKTAVFDPSKAMTTFTRLAGSQQTTDEQMRRFETLRADRLQSGRTGGAQGEELALLQTFKAQAQGMREFYQAISVETQKTGLIEDGNFSMLSGDLMAERIREQMGIGAGVKGIAGSHAEANIYSGLVEMNRALGNSSDRLGDWSSMMKGTFLPGSLAEGLRELAGLNKPAAEGGNKKDPEFKVTINRIEVQSDDPDRFVVGLTETVRDAVRNRSSAYETVMEGR